VGGLGGTDASSGMGGGGSDGNLASAAVSAALRYRAQAPLVDGLMKELGLDGSTLANLANSGAGAATLIAEPTSAE
jgi:hypothetical protein